jgi:uncharacterized protein with GYD domain
MPKYMFQASYTTEGLKGLFKDGGSKRREALDHAVEGMGGKMEVFYYAFGADDVFGIADMPDNVSTAALALVINASGAAKVRTVVLLTPEEIDEATKKSIDYRPPGQ